MLGLNARAEEGYYKEECTDDRSHCVRIIHEACARNPSSCESVNTNDGYTLNFLKGTMEIENQKSTVEEAQESANKASGKMQGRLPSEPETPKSTPEPSPAPVAKAPDNGLIYEMNQCESISQQAIDSCSESNSLMNKVRNGLDSTSRSVAGWAQQSPQACNSMANNASIAFSSGMGAWKSSCIDALSQCNNVCEPIIKKFRAQGFGDHLAQTQRFKAQCNQLNSKMISIEQNMNDAKNTALAGLKCQQDALAAQQLPQNLSPSGLANNPGGSYPGLGGGEVGPGFSNMPATLGGSGRDPYGRDERATGGAGDPTSLADGAMDNALSGKPYEKSRIDQLSLSGGGGGVSGKVTYSDSSLPKQKNNQNYGGGGSSLNSTVNGGYYGGGGMGSGAFRQASIAPVGGYRPSATGSNQAGLPTNGKPDLRRFLPPGGPKRVAASPESFRPEDSKIGRDGVTGPRTSNFGKVRYRYNAHRATLAP